MQSRSLAERIQFAYEGGQVVRFHTRQGIKPITDAAHSHGVALMAMFICEALNHSPSANLLMACVTHDLAEQTVSDLAAPLKWALPNLAAQVNSLEQELLETYGLKYPLTEEEKFVLKLADNLEGLLYCAGERWLGNRKIEIIAERWMHSLQEQVQSAPFTVVNLVHTVIQIYRRAHNGLFPAPDFTDLRQYTTRSLSGQLSSCSSSKSE